MGTGSSACWPRWKFTAHVAFGRFDNGQIGSHIAIRPTLVVEHLGHSDVFVRARSSTGATTYANRFMNLDDSGILIPHNGSGWASDHANRITALHASFDNLQTVMRQPLPDKAGIPIMRIATGFDAIITARAAMKIDHHGLTAIV